MVASFGAAPNVQFRTVLAGILQVLFGCLVGFIPPTAVPFFRAVVAAHIEFAMNGILQAVVGLAVPLMHLSPNALLTMEALLMVGTWLNGFGLLVAGITGVSSPLTPIMNQHKPREVSPHSACHNILLTCGITIVVALSIAAVGLIRGQAARRAAAASKSA